MSRLVERTDCVLWEEQEEEECVEHVDNKKQPAGSHLIFLCKQNIHFGGQSGLVASKEANP